MQYRLSCPWFALESVQEGRKLKIAETQEPEDMYVSQHDWTLEEEEPTAGDSDMRPAGGCAITGDCGVSRLRGSDGRSGTRGHIGSMAFGATWNAGEGTQCLQARPARKRTTQVKNGRALPLPELPAHIVSKERSLLGARSKPVQILVCQTCGGSGSAKQRVRFVGNHASCAFRLDEWRRPKRILSQAERMHLAEIAGSEELQHKAKRLRATNLLLLEA